jgi:GNAT superfamily N-acetyltransferase
MTADGDSQPAFEVVEGPHPFAVDRITALHAAYYARAHGFGAGFEAKVARELAEFTGRWRAGRDAMFLALGAAPEPGGTRPIEGSIVIDGLHAREEGAHLRWFITSDATRGRGTGRELLRHAVSFSDACGYPRLFLWTFAGLDAARHLYESAGFRLMHQAEGAQWGSVVQEQRFERIREAR